MVRVSWRALGAWAFLLIAGAIAADSLWHVVQQHHPLPSGDQWATVGDFEKWRSGRFGLSDLAAQHNEHRIVVPRVFFLLDYVAFRGQGWFLLACIAAVQLLHAIVLFRYPPVQRLPGHLRVLVAGIVLAAMFSGMQIENLGWAFQLQFVVVYLCVTISIVSLLHARQHRGARRWALIGSAVAATAAAQWSSSNGVLAWPVLGAFAWYARLPWRTIAVIAASAAASCLLWAHGYVLAPGRGNLSELLKALPQLASYVLVYVGNPFRFEPPRGAFAIGALGVAAFAVLLGFALRGRRLSVEAAGLLHVMLFVLMTAGITAVGRIELGVEQALSSRYVTSSLLFWACVQLLLLMFAHGQDRGRLGPVARVSAWSLAAAILSALAIQQREATSWFADRPRVQQIATDALLVGVRDELALAASCGLPTDWVLEQASVLRANSLSVFAGEDQGWIGRPLRSVFEVAPGEALPGGIHESTWRGDDGFRIYGAVALDPRFTFPARVLFTGPDDTILGLGATGTRTNVTDEFSFEGFARVDALPASIGACVLDQSRRAWRVRGVVTLRKLDTGVLVPWSADVSSHSPMHRYVAEGAWARDAFPPGVPSLGGHEVHSSWAGDDANTGRLAFGPFPCSGEDELFVPLMLGPDPGGQIVRVVDVDTGRPVVELQRPRVDPHQWVLWRVALPAAMAGRQLCVVAEDKGVQWGQWMAVAAPWVTRRA